MHLPDFVPSWPPCPALSDAPCGPKIMNVFRQTFYQRIKFWW